MEKSKRMFIVWMMRAVVSLIGCNDDGTSRPLGVLTVPLMTSLLEHFAIEEPQNLRKYSSYMFPSAESKAERSLTFS